jgi:hypothetical protein
LKHYNLNHISNPRLFSQRRRGDDYVGTDRDGCYLGTESAQCVPNEIPTALTIAGTKMPVAGQAQLPCRSVATSTHVLLLVGLY